jgi:AmmeMemoRadiSam system protein A
MTTNQPLSKKNEYNDLLILARTAIKYHLERKSFSVPPVYVRKFGHSGASFVTLTQDGELRGCVGSLVAYRSLYLDVIENAVHAAVHDSRFSPVQYAELEKIHIEVSILSQPTPLVYKNADDLLSKLDPSLGVIIEENGYHATFLPQVWEQVPDKREFLEHLCQKAGLSSDEWKTGKLNVKTYTVFAVEEKK